MPLSSFASEALGGVVRVAIEIVVELLFHGTGRVILAGRSKRHTSDGACTLVGALFWLGVVVLGLWLWL